jgi:hypothetical protein
MDPAFVDAGTWIRIGQAVNLLYALAGLAIDGAVAFLLARAIVPSLAETGDLPPAALGLRRLFYPIFAVALLLAIATLWRVVVVVGRLEGQIFPRWAI